MVHLKLVRLTRFLSASYFHFMYVPMAPHTPLECAMSAAL